MKTQELLRQVEADEAEWLKQRSRPAFMRKLYLGVVARFHDIGRPTDAVVETIELGPCETNWRGRFKANTTTQRFICNGWLLGQGRHYEWTKGDGWGAIHYIVHEEAILGEDGGWWIASSTSEKFNDSYPELKEAVDRRSSTDPEELRWLHMNTDHAMRVFNLTPATLGLQNEWPVLPHSLSQKQGYIVLGEVGPQRSFTISPDDCRPPS